MHAYQTPLPKNYISVNPIIYRQSPSFSSPSPFLSCPTPFSSVPAMYVVHFSQFLLFACLLPSHVLTMFPSSALPYSLFTCSPCRCCARNIEDEHGNAPNLVPAAGGGAFNAVGTVRHASTDFSARRYLCSRKPQN